MRSSLHEFFTGALSDRRRHLVSIDPCCHDPETISNTILAAVEAGADGFLLGGSTGVDRVLVETFAKKIRATLEKRLPNGSRPPLILFPSSAQTGLANDADGVLFLSLLNTRNVRFLIREQAMAAPFLRQWGLEAVGCGMIVVEPGQTVGAVGQADLLKPDDVSLAVGYTTAAQAFGFPLIYLNAGSRSPSPVPAEMIGAVSKNISVPLIVGGGLTDAAKAARAIESGADIIVTGTAIETADNLAERIAAISTAVHARPASAKP